MQLPASILDQRLIADGTLAELRRRGIEVHARSIFLQGLLFLNREQLPPSLLHVASELDTRRSFIREAGLSLVDAALNFALSQESVSRFVVGVTSVAELHDIVAAVRRPQPTLDWTPIAMRDPIALDPRRW